jgi:hypothetical protein
MFQCNINKILYKDCVAFMVRCVFAEGSALGFGRGLITSVSAIVCVDL